MDTTEEKTSGKKAGYKTTPKKLYRSSQHKIIAGVAGGIAQYFSIDPTIVRIIFIVLALFQGSGIVGYLVLWLLLPSDDAQRKHKEFSTEGVKENFTEMQNRADTLLKDLKRKHPLTPRTFFGVLLFVIGGIVLLLSMDFFIPLALVLIGIYLLTAKKN